MILLYVLSLQGLTQVEEMLSFCVLPITSLYQLRRGHYTYSGHVIDLPQDVASFAISLPRLPSEVDVIIVRKEGGANSHYDFHVRRPVVLSALQWLLANNRYCSSVCINCDALALLPVDGNLTSFCSMMYVGGRFARHPRFCYFALNTEMQWRALQAGRIYIRQHLHNAQLSVEELRDIVGLL